MPATAPAASTKAPPPVTVFNDDDDCSDTDSESGDSITDVHLGLADGELEDDDESNPLVSRIGGKAAWLPTKSIPPPSVATCRHCDTVMELLVQLFAPLEDSPYDRTILAWGCARATCQRKGAGSLRVVRHLQYNTRWAAKLEKKKARQQDRVERERQQEEQARKRKEEEEAKSKVNPFAASGASAFNGGGLGGSLFGGGGNPFSTSTPAPGAKAEPKKDATPVAQEEEDSDDESEEDEEAATQARLAEELAMKAALTTASSSHSDWASKAPHYSPPLYLNTVPEASSSARAGDKAIKLTKEAAALRKKAEAAKANDATDDELRGLEKESYERMMLVGVDEILEKFMARVGAEGRQVVRYELGGQPLPFNGQGDLYDALWPKQKQGGVTTVGRGAVAAQAAAAAAGGRSYDASKVPPCEACGSKRTFELQLMPALVHTLRADKIQDVDANQDDAAKKTNEDGDAQLDAEARRRRDLEAALGRRLAPKPDWDGISRSGGAEAAKASAVASGGKTGLCWSTAMVFVCEKDCCIPREEQEGESWREEWCGIQFED